MLFRSLETTGLDTKNDKIIDVGMITIDNGHVVHKYSALVKHPTIAIPLEIQELTKISPELIIRNGHDADKVFEHTIQTINSSDYVIAHNGHNFDFPMLESNSGRPICCNRIDTCVDIPYPQSITTRKLIYLAAEHHLPVSKPAHRAIADCETLHQLIMCYDIKEIIERSHQPNITLRAVINREDNDLARKIGRAHV